MPTANVTVKTLHNTQLLVEFSIDDIPHKFTGPMAGEVMNFITDKAIITYDSAANFNGEGKFEGKVGKEEIAFTIHGGISNSEVTGTLVTPLPQMFMFEGVANWYVG